MCPFSRLEANPSFCMKMCCRSHLSLAKHVTRHEEVKLQDAQQNVTQSINKLVLAETHPATLHSDNSIANCSTSSEMLANATSQHKGSITHGSGL